MRRLKKKIPAQIAVPEPEPQQVQAPEPPQEPVYRTPAVATDADKYAIHIKEDWRIMINKIAEVIAKTMGRPGVVWRADLAAARYFLGSAMGFSSVYRRDVQETMPAIASRLERRNHWMNHDRTSDYNQEYNGIRYQEDSNWWYMYHAEGKRPVIEEEQPRTFMQLAMFFSYLFHILKLHDPDGYVTYAASQTAVEWLKALECDEGDHGVAIFDKLNEIDRNHSNNAMCDWIAIPFRKKPTAKQDKTMEKMKKIADKVTYMGTRANMRSTSRVTLWPQLPEWPVMGELDDEE